jgi:hypothetical protein
MNLVLLPPLPSLWGIILFFRGLYHREIVNLSESNERELPRQLKREHPIASKYLFLSQYYPSCPPCLQESLLKTVCATQGMHPLKTCGNFTLSLIARLKSRSIITRATIGEYNEYN